jgi:hypothetical protein
MKMRQGIQVIGPPPWICKAVPEDRKTAQFVLCNLYTLPTPRVVP